MLASCAKNSMEKVELVSRKDAIPSETSTNIRLLYSDSAKVRVMVEAPLLERYTTDTNYVEFPDGVLLEFYAPNGELETKLTANYAIQWDERGIMEAREDVVVVNSEGEKLATEQLRWDRKERKIFSEEFVKITTEEQILWGDGLEAVEDFSSYKILNPMGQLYIREGADSTQAAPQTPEP